MLYRNAKDKIVTLLGEFLDGYEKYPKPKSTPAQTPPNKEGAMRIPRQTHPFLDERFPQLLQRIGGIGREQQKPSHESLHSFYFGQFKLLRSTMTHKEAEDEAKIRLQERYEMYCSTKEGKAKEAEDLRFWFGFSFALFRAELDLSQADLVDELARQAQKDDFKKRHRGFPISRLSAPFISHLETALLEKIPTALLPALLDLYEQVHCGLKNTEEQLKESVYHLRKMGVLALYHQALSLKAEANEAQEENVLQEENDLSLLDEVSSRFLCKQKFLISNKHLHLPEKFTEHVQNQVQGFVMLVPLIGWHWFQSQGREQDAETMSELFSCMIEFSKPAKQIDKAVKEKMFPSSLFHDGTGKRYEDLKSLWNNYLTIQKMMEDLEKNTVLIYRLLTGMLECLHSENLEKSDVEPKNRVEVIIHLYFFFYSLSYCQDEFSGNSTHNSAKHRFPSPGEFGETLKNFWLYWPNLTNFLYVSPNAFRILLGFLLKKIREHRGLTQKDAYRAYTEKNQEKMQEEALDNNSFISNIERSPKKTKTPPKNKMRRKTLLVLLEAYQVPKGSPLYVAALFLHENIGLHIEIEEPSEVVSIEVNAPKVEGPPDVSDELMELPFKQVVQTMLASAFSWDKLPAHVQAEIISTFSWDKLSKRVQDEIQQKIAEKMAEQALSRHVEEKQDSVEEKRDS